MKKIILILTGVAVLLIVITIIFLNRQNNESTEESSAVPTGIIVPTQEVQPNELDVVKIDPRDQARNVQLEKPLIITFSKPFSSAEAEFLINPDTPVDITINGNNLEVRPQATWQTGTEYTYTINFKGDPEKVRLYKFYTAGPTQDATYDTQPEGLYEKEVEEQKKSRPDIYVTNNTPYTAPTFSIISQFENDPPHFYFIVTSQTNDKTKVQNDVKVWLYSLDLSDETISKLDIRYE